MIANIPLSIIITPNHTKREKFHLLWRLSLYWLFFTSKAKGCVLATVGREDTGMPPPVSLRRFSQILIPYGWQPISTPPCPEHPSWPHMNCPVCSVTPTQTAPPGKTLKPWERREEGEGYVTTVFSPSFTRAPEDHLLISYSWHSGHSAHKYP